LRPNFADFLKELYGLTAGELQTIDRYEVGKKLALDKEQTDHLVDQLSDIGMIRKILRTKIILSPEAKRFIDSNKASS
jgi:hypothetical protein